MDNSELLMDLEQEVIARLQMPQMPPASPTFEVVATVLGPVDLERPDEMAVVLDSRAKKQIYNRSDGRTVTGITSAELEYSDHAECEDVDGVTANAFITMQRCYRLVLQVAYQSN
jgi:hypothetical protein